MSKPAIAAVNGPAVGSGLGIAAGCDMRIASARRGSAGCSCAAASCPTMRALRLMPQIIGYSRAFEWGVTGRTLDADACSRSGSSAKWSSRTGFCRAAANWRARSSTIVRRSPCRRSSSALTESLYQNLDDAVRFTERAQKVVRATAGSFRSAQGLCRKASAAVEGPVTDAPTALEPVGLSVLRLPALDVFARHRRRRKRLAVWSTAVRFERPQSDGRGRRSCGAGSRDPRQDAGILAAGGRASVTSCRVVQYVTPAALRRSGEADAIRRSSSRAPRRWSPRSSSSAAPRQALIEIEAVAADRPGRAPPRSDGADVRRLGRARMNCWRPEVWNAGMSCGRSNCSLPAAAEPAGRSDDR